MKLQTYVFFESLCSSHSIRSRARGACQQTVFMCVCGSRSVRAPVCLSARRIHMSLWVGHVHAGQVSSSIVVGAHVRADPVLFATEANEQVRPTEASEQVRDRSQRASTSRVLASEQVRPAEASEQVRPCVVRDRRQRASTSLHFLISHPCH